MSTFTYLTKEMTTEYEEEKVPESLYMLRESKEDDEIYAIQIHFSQDLENQVLHTQTLTLAEKQLKSRLEEEKMTLLLLDERIAISLYESDRLIQEQILCDEAFARSLA